MPSQYLPLPPRALDLPTTETSLSHVGAVAVETGPSLNTCAGASTPPSAFRLRRASYTDVVSKSLQHREEHLTINCPPDECWLMESLCGNINNKIRVYKQTCPQTISVNCPLSALNVGKTTQTTNSFICQ